MAASLRPASDFWGYALSFSATYATFMALNDIYGARAQRVPRMRARAKGHASAWRPPPQGADRDWARWRHRHESTRPAASLFPSSELRRCSSQERHSYGMVTGGRLAVCNSCPVAWRLCSVKATPRLPQLPCYARIGGWLVQLVSCHTPRPPLFKAQASASIRPPAHCDAGGGTSKSHCLRDYKWAAGPAADCLNGRGARCMPHSRTGRRDHRADVQAAAPRGARRCSLCH